jgi:hypothetical protein
LALACRGTGRIFSLGHFSLARVGSFLFLATSCTGSVLATAGLL